MRESPTLAEPPPSLDGFPSVVPPKSLVRVCRAEQRSWWFSCDGSGRFDLPAPDGTCYLATDSYAAIREASRLGPVTTAWVADREVRRLAPPDPAARLAATTRQAAGQFGVTTELATIVPYDLPRRWASAFRAHGYAGIRHQLRHDRRARPSGVALFGSVGAPDLVDPGGVPLDVAAVRNAGVQVFEPPSTAVLTVVP